MFNYTYDMEIKDGKLILYRDMECSWRTEHTQITLTAEQVYNYYELESEADNIVMLMDWMKSNCDRVIKSCEVATRKHNTERED